MGVIALACSCGARGEAGGEARTPEAARSAEARRAPAALRLLPAGAPRDGTEWSIESTPPGARIWFDGADTGARTPALFLSPSPGKHEIRLTLEGYADDVDAIVQREGVGLSYGRNLRPRAEVEHEAETRRAAQRPVDEAAREATRRFLGPDVTRVEVRLDRGASIGLPPATLVVRGDGASKVSWLGADQRHEQSAPVRAGPGEVRAIFEALVAQGFTGVVGDGRRGVPDEVHVSITVTNASGATSTAAKWWDDPHPRFDPVLNTLLRVVETLPPEVRRQAGF
jgi:hypothetical protein